MAQGTDGLRDIRGLDISALDILLAQSVWWLMLLGGVVLGAFILWRLWQWWQRRNGLHWSIAAEQEWQRLQSAHRDDPRALLGGLSELLRRIALVHYPREEVAGLQGQDWLRWLAAHDPAGFDWIRQGKPLVKVPYAKTSDYAEDSIQPLVEAVRRWCRPTEKPHTVRRRKAGG